MDTGTSSDSLANHIHGRRRPNQANVCTDVIAEIRQHLSKRYDFDEDHLYVLPETSKYFRCPAWQNENLCALKKDLNVVKSQLNNFDLERWHAHTHFTNLGGFVIPNVRKFKPELLTQAWCKFYDILESFSVIPSFAIESGLLNSIHLCEAPGAFIASLNHNLILNFPHVKWQWRATTLNPYYEGNPLRRMINDDRFLMKTLENWLFGEDFTGNICQRANLESLKKDACELGPIHLVTADGSFDCTDDPAEQEGKVAPLLFCEVLSALSILCVGGSFVLKIFTMFEHQTVCMLYLLRCVFKKMTVYKPIVSKEGNSELYVVCLGYKGRDECHGVLNELSTRMEEAACGPAMFGTEDIDEFFLCEIERCATFFTRIQVGVIERNIQLFENLSSLEDQKFRKIKSRIADLFIENFCIRPLPSDGYLVGKQSFYKRGQHFAPRDESGTFAERQHLKENDCSALVEFCKQKLEKMHFFWPKENDVCWLQSSGLLPDGCSVEILPRKGKPFKTVLSSRFCTGNLLNIFNDVLKNTMLVNSYDFWSDNDSSFLHNSATGLAYSEFKTIDVRDIPWTTHYHKAQNECLRILGPVLRELETGNNFVLIGLPLLTQFNVGLVYLLALKFEKVGFASPRQVGNCIVFQNLLSSDMKDLDNILDGIEEKEDLALISLVNITAMSEEYLSTVTLLNHVLLRKTALVLAWNY